MSSTTKPTPHDHRPIGAAAAFGAMFLWTVGNVFIAGGALGGLTLAFWRSLLAVIVYGAVLWIRRTPLRRSDVRWVWQGALAYSLDIATFFMALKLTSLTIATTVSALQPIGIMAVSALVLGERVTRADLALTVVAVIGAAAVVLAAGDHGDVSTAGILLSVAALGSWIWYFVGSKKARPHVDVLVFQTWISLCATATMLPLALIAEHGSLWPKNAPPSAVWLVVGVVAVPGTGHLLMNWAHGHTSLLVTSMLTLFSPPLSALLGMWFLDQPVTVGQWVGIAITLAALAAFLWNDQRQQHIAAADVDPIP